MKKINILAIAVLFTAISQAGFAQTLKLGIKGGADINKIDGRSFSDKFTFGYHLGGFAIIGLGEKLAIQPEVLFSQVNVDTADNYSSVYNFNNISEVKLKYLKIPVLLNYNVSKLLTLQVGPQFGILIDKNNNIFQNGQNAFKGGDFSMLGGLQLNILKLKVYGRYAIGLSDINDIDNRESWKNQSIQLGVGYTF